MSDNAILVSQHSMETIKVRRLSPAMGLWSRKTANERKTLALAYLPALRIWIQEHDKLMARNDDQFLIAFLRYCKYNFDLTKQRIEYFYDYKTNIAPDLLANGLYDEKIQALCAAGILSTLRDPITPIGPRIHFSRMSRIDANIHRVEDIFRLFYLRSQIEIVSDDNAVISGVVEILDCSQLPLRFLTQYNNSTFKKMSAYVQHGEPINLVATHIFNASLQVNLVLKLVRSCMMDKSLLHIHTSIESLQNAIGIDYLPPEYGGKNCSADEGAQNLCIQLTKFKEYFTDNQEYGFNRQS